MRNKRTALGFLLSLLLHALLLWLIWEKKRDLLLPPPPSMSPHKVKLDLKHFVPPAPPTTPATKTPQSAPPSPVSKTHKTASHKEAKKPIEEKRDVSPAAPVETEAKQKPIEKPIETVRKNPKPVPRTEYPKRVKKTPRPVTTAKKPVAKKKSKKVRRTHHKDKLAGFLSKGLYTLHRPSHTSSIRRTPPALTRLYGKEYYSFTKEQRDFIRNHLREIQRITQNTLVHNGYPEVAVQTHQQGTNVVSFYLHPNGDISDLKIITPTGYEALDKNTLEVIRIAYMHYPKPKTKTKIIFYVNYSLY